MAYTAVPHIVAGNIYTPTMYNTFLSDNFDSGVMRMLADSTLGVAAASFDFTSIPATFAHLMLVLYGRGDTAATDVGAQLRMDNDSSALYYSEVLDVNGTTVTASESIAGTSAVVGRVPAASGQANWFGSCAILIPHYAAGSNAKGWTSHGSCARGTTTGNTILRIGSGLWSNISLINRLTLFPAAGNFAAGSRATLYGLPQ